MDLTGLARVDRWIRSITLRFTFMTKVTPASRRNSLKEKRFNRFGPSWSLNSIHYTPLQFMTKVTPASRKNSLKEKGFDRFGPSWSLNSIHYAPLIWGILYFNRTWANLETVFCTRRTRPRWGSLFAVSLETQFRRYSLSWSKTGSMEWTPRWLRPTRWYSTEDVNSKI